MHLRDLAGIIGGTLDFWQAVLEFRAQSGPINTKTSRPTFWMSFWGKEVKSARFQREEGQPTDPGRPKTYFS